MIWVLVIYEIVESGLSAGACMNFSGTYRRYEVLATVYTIAAESAKSL